MVDADCLIAGVLTFQGATSQLLDVWGQGAFELVVCPQLIFEVRKALLSPRIAGRYRVARDDAEGFAKQLAEEALLADDPRDPPRVVPDDPKDDYLVALTLASSADLLVTRDKHFEEVQVRGFAIVGPREALDQVATSI